MEEFKNLKLLVWAILMTSTVVFGLSDRVIAVMYEPTVKNLLLLATSSVVALCLLFIMPDVE